MFAHKSEISSNQLILEVPRNYSVKLAVLPETGI